MLHSVLAVAVSALGFYVSTGLGVVWPLAWLAPVPVLIVAFERSWRVAALMAFVASSLGGLSIVSAYGPAAAILAVPLAIAFAAGVLATRFAARRMAAWLAAFVFPAVLTACEFVSPVPGRRPYWQARTTLRSHKDTSDGSPSHAGRQVRPASR